MLFNFLDKPLENIPTLEAGKINGFVGFTPYDIVILSEEDEF